MPVVDVHPYSRLRSNRFFHTKKPFFLYEKYGTNVNENMDDYDFGNLVDRESTSPMHAIKALSNKQNIFAN